MKNYDKDFELLVTAAVKKERCPQTSPHGPLSTGAVTALVRDNKIRSEVYRHNFRVVTILVGPHKGKSTVPAESGLKPYRVNGLHIGRFQRYGKVAIR